MINIFNLCVPDDVLFLTQQQQQQQQLQHQQRQSQTSTPDVALQSQMITHRMQVTTQHSTSSASQRSSYHQPQPQHPRASQVSSVRLSNISSGGSSDLDSRKCSLN